MLQGGKNMENTTVKYAPGMRIIVRGEEWMVKKDKEVCYPQKDSVPLLLFRLVLLFYWGTNDTI